MRVAKTKALISFAVTAKLICAFVVAYADCWFSHEAAQIKSVKQRNINFENTTTSLLHYCWGSKQMLVLAIQFMLYRE